MVLCGAASSPRSTSREIKQIVLRGGHRAPIVMSFWLVQNADVFILSRFIGDTELGVYALASRLGFVVSFLPQGFRMAMRPLRKSAAFQAVRDQYGRATVQGQLLGYFTLLCIFAVLIMILGGEVLVDAAPAAYADAAGLIPFTAAAFVMPAVYRTVNQNVNLSHKRPLFIARLPRRRGLVHRHHRASLAPEIGAYAAPIGMLFGFGVPSLLHVRPQPARREADRLPLSRGRTRARDRRRDRRPSSSCSSSAACSSSGSPRRSLVVFLGLLVPLRVIPEQHWRPLIHVARSVRSGSAAAFRPRRGLRALEPGRARGAADRGASGPARGTACAPTTARAARALVARRCAGSASAAGSPVGRPTANDAEISVFLFEDVSRAESRPDACAGCSPTAPSPTTCARSRTWSASSPGSPTTAGRASASGERGRRLPGAERRRLAARRREMRRAKG